MRLTIRIGKPVLSFLYSGSQLLFGCFAGMRWAMSLSDAVGIAILGAALLVNHDLLVTLFSLWAARVWIRTRNKQHITL